MKTDLVATGFIINDNKILLIHHAKLDKWLPVGGHMEPDEVPDQTVLREIKEETNLDVEIISGGTSQHPLPFSINVHNVGDHDHCSFDFLCKVRNVEELRINNELKAFKWFSREELDTVLPGVRELALKAFDLLSE
ncbi:MAG: NUDIX domain-containing protein [Candidatus Nanoarchaeia archaeon]|jgi:ADP-ribose pyrophosphatase YjhB (NUDIX family)